MQKLNVKKLQAFSKKFCDFETQHGTDKTLDEAQKLIMTLASNDKDIEDS